MSFITIDKLNGSSGETISTITVPEYQGLEDRTQSFKVVVDGKEVFVNVQQKAFKPFLETNKQVVPFTQEVLTQSLQITSNFNWEARTDSSWFTLSQTEGNKGTTTIEISTSSIDSPSENRNGIINFYFGDTFVTAITVKQEFEVIFEVSMTSIDMTEELTTSIDITSNVDWYCEVDGTWINVDIVSGFGDKTITVTAQTFNGQDRNANIKFYVSGELIDTIRIYQIKLRTDQFYIEPYNSSFTINLNNIYFEYYNEEIEEWDEVSTVKTFNKKTYFRYGGSFDVYTYNPLKLDGRFNIGGNIESLVGNFILEKDNFSKYGYAGYQFCRRLFSNTQVVDASKLILPSYTFERCYEEMFLNCKNLVNPPALPATILDKECYSSMFWKCTSLVNAPELPASILAEGCYINMFAGCTSLVNPPELSATILAEGCYGGMFQFCTSLINAPELPVTILTEGCYSNMFLDCTSLVNAPALPATTLANTCYSYMFAGCTSLVNASELPATTLAEGCYSTMFWGCTSLVNAPELPASILAKECYSYMFQDCTSLNKITMLATDISASDCLCGWVRNVSSDGVGVSPTGTFTKKKGVVIPYGINGIPNENWTVIEVP